MQSLIRAITIAYLIFVTLLLLSPDPARLIHYRSVWLFLTWLSPWSHLLAFYSLTLLALTPRWPAPRWVVVLMLALYGGATELGQKLFPPRTPEWKDWMQDLGGVALGAVSCWLLHLLGEAAANLWRRRRALPAPVEQWQVLHNIMSRSAEKQSLWG